MNDIDEKIKERLNGIFSSPAIASKVVNLVVHNRPAGWSRKSNAPYYKEKYALQLKSEIDKMIESGKPLCFRYSVWCTEETRMSKQTLYNRINQSIRYLIEQLDIDRYYAKWYESVEIERERSIGISIYFIVGLSGTEQFKAELIEPKENAPIWKREMDAWLESDNIRPFCKEGLALTEQEVIDLSVELDTLSGIKASVTSSSVKIIRMNSI